MSKRLNKALDFKKIRQNLILLFKGTPILKRSLIDLVWQSEKQITRVQNTDVVIGTNNFGLYRGTKKIRLFYKRCPEKLTWSTISNLAIKKVVEKASVIPL